MRLLYLLNETSVLLHLFEFKTQSTFNRFFANLFGIYLPFTTLSLRDPLRESNSLLHNVKCPQSYQMFTRLFQLTRTILLTNLIYDLAISPGWEHDILQEKFRYLCIYVTVIKPNFHKRFRADNGKNRNMPIKRLANQI